MNLQLANFQRFQTSGHHKWVPEPCSYLWNWRFDSSLWSQHGELGVPYWVQDSYGSWGRSGSPIGCRTLNGSWGKVWGKGRMLLLLPQILPWYCHGSGERERFLHVPVPKTLKASWEQDGQVWGEKDSPPFPLQARCAFSSGLLSNGKLLPLS